jgi:hypothetical protein
VIDITSAAARRTAGPAWCRSLVGFGASMGLLAKRDNVLVNGRGAVAR